MELKGKGAVVTGGAMGIGLAASKISIHPSYIAKGMFEGSKLGYPGNPIAPLLKDHDVIVEAIVESALKRGKYSPKRPWRVNLIPRLRLMPDSLFQEFVVIMGVTGSMKCWAGREKK